MPSLASHSELSTWLGCVCALLFLVAGVGSAAADHYGQVTFRGLPVPGATVTASQGDKQFVTSTDQQGVYRLADLAEGLWTLRVQMIGFSTVSQDVNVAPDSPPSMWELKLRSFEEIAREIPPPAVEPAPNGTAAPAGVSATGKPDVTGGHAADKAGDKKTDDKTPRAVGLTPDTTTATPRGFQRAGVNAANPAPAPANTPPPPGDAPAADSPFGAADGFLINGSVNNGAASPFAQLAAFGNNRRSGRSLYNGGVAAILGNSNWDARPFSFTGEDATKPDYSDVQVMGQFGGPLKIPGLLKNGGNIFVGVSAHLRPQLRLRNRPSCRRRSNGAAIFRSRTTPSAVSSRSSIRRPAQPFPGNVIPGNRISPQAAALLAYYPLPNIDPGGRYNFQTPLVTVTRQDAVQSRLTQPPFGRNQLYGNVAYQRTTTESTNVFGFTDAGTVSGIDTAVNWSRRFSQSFSLRLRYQFTRLDTEVTPYFANRTNVSGEAGISGNNQDPVNWGPPGLAFASGVEGLASAQYASNSNRTHAWSAESLSSRGRHNVTFGGGVHMQRFDVLSQQNAARNVCVYRRVHGLRSAPISCWASRAPARSRSATPTNTCARPPTRSTSPTTGG